MRDNGASMEELLFADLLSCKYVTVCITDSCETQHAATLQSTKYRSTPKQLFAGRALQAVVCLGCKNSRPSAENLYRSRSIVHPKRLLQEDLEATVCVEWNNS